jgi:hypothetical protein
LPAEPETFRLEPTFEHGLAMNSPCWTMTPWHTLPGMCHELGVGQAVNRKLHRGALNPG